MAACSKKAGMESGRINRHPELQIAVSFARDYMDHSVQSCILRQHRLVQNRCRKAPPFDLRIREWRKPKKRESRLPRQACSSCLARRVHGWCWRLLLCCSSGPSRSPLFFQGYMFWILPAGRGEYDSQGGHLRPCIVIVRSDRIALERQKLIVRPLDPSPKGGASV